jgi:hypothetical protein
MITIPFLYKPIKYNPCFPLTTLISVGGSEPIKSRLASLGQGIVIQWEKRNDCWG